MPPRVELDDQSLVDIFSRVGDAKQLAICSLVCRRWQELRWAVSKLHFHFRVGSSKDLRQKELVIASILRRTNKDAPGCLKHLIVSLERERVESDLKATCHWLPYAAESVTELELELDTLEYSMSVWSSLSFFRSLERLTLSRGYNLDQFLPMSNEPPFRRLTSCSVAGPTATAELLEAVVAICPALKYLSFTAFVDESRGAINVVGSNIEHLELSKEERDQGEQRVVLSLDTPRLSVLRVGIGKYPMEIKLASAENLSELVLYDSCKLQSQTEFKKLESLTMVWDWTPDLMLAVLDLVPAVIEFYMANLASVVPGEMRLGEFCARFANLKTVHIDGFSLQSFSSNTGLVVLEGLTVHLWVHMLEGDPDILKNLLRVNRIRMMVVHYTLSEIRDKDEEWQFLCNLELLFPGRIKFKHES